MKNIDGNRMQAETNLETDICIIGGGAAGIAIARCFIGEKRKVLLVESGDNSYREDTQALYDFTSIGHPLRAERGYISRNRYYGGSTNTWHGGCAPLDPIDFEQREWIPNSGWPFNYDELSVYFRKAADTLALPEYELFHSDAWKKYVHDCPPNFLDGEELSPAIFLFAKRPINMRSAYARSLAKSANIQVVLNANVIEIEADENQRQVVRLHLATLGRKRFTVSAKRYVLCCGGWENARLLLASRRHSPAGIGNGQDLVGRFYQEHPKTIAGRIVPHTKTLRSSILMWERKINRSGYMRLSVKLSRAMQKKHRLANNYVHIRYPKSITDAIAQSDSLFQNLGMSRASIHKMVKLAPKVFRLIEAFERRALNLPLRFNELAMFSHIEQIPTAASRLELSRETDALGMPKLQANLVVSSEDKAGLIKFHEVIGEILSRDGLGIVECELEDAEADWPYLTDSSHHIGTTRMSSEPAKGVVDPNCKVHGMSNLYISGSSVFPTGGHVNSTLTIVALAERLADHLREANL